MLRNEAAGTLVRQEVIPVRGNRLRGRALLALALITALLLPSCGWIGSVSRENPEAKPKSGKAFVVEGEPIGTGQYRYFATEIAHPPDSADFQRKIERRMKIWGVVSAEARTRGLVPTDEEVRVSLEQQRQASRRASLERKKELTLFLERLGVTEDEYWDLPETLAQERFFLMTQSLARKIGDEIKSQPGEFEDHLRKRRQDHYRNWLDRRVDEAVVKPLGVRD